LAVSAPQDNNYFGSVFVYTRSGDGVWTQDALLMPTYAPELIFGSSIAFSEDGSVLAVAAQGYTENNKFTGAVWVYTNKNGVWQQGEKLVGDNTATANSVTITNFPMAMSPKGDKIVVGRPSDNQGKGAVCVFEYDASSDKWSQVGNKITNVDTAAYTWGGFGNSVGVSTGFNGETIVAIGQSNDRSYNYTPGQGSAYVFSYDTTTGLWNQLSKLIGTGVSTNCSYPSATQGSSIKFSTDGKKLAVGGNTDDGYVGAVWVYTHDAASNSWFQDGDKIVGLGYTRGNVGIYQSMSMSFVAADNSYTLAVGGPGDNYNTGAVWVFTEKY